MEVFRMSRQVWICDECGEEHQTESEADDCCPGGF